MRRTTYGWSKLYIDDMSNEMRIIDTQRKAHTEYCVNNDISNKTECEMFVAFSQLHNK